MPRSTREYLLRFAEQAKEGCLRVAGNAERIIETYDKGEYEQIAFWKAILKTQVEIAEMIDEFKKNNM